MSDAKIEGPHTDEGTGAYPGPPAEVTVESSADNSSTGAVEGPPAEVTIESLEHLDGPTGAHPGPPAETTSYAWPAVAPDQPEESEESEVAAKAVSGDEDEVEDKTVRRTKKKGA